MILGEEEVILYRWHKAAVILKAGVSDPRCLVSKMLRKRVGNDTDWSRHGLACLPRLHVGPMKGKIFT